MDKTLSADIGRSQVATIESENFIAVAVIIVIVATTLRLIFLGKFSLWIDEAIYANNAHTTLRNLFEITRDNNTTPIGLPLLLFVIEKFSSSTWILRFPSVLFSVGAIVIILSLPRVGISRGYCLVVAAVMAISPSQIRYAQEVREYALSVFAVAVLLYFFFKYLEKGSLSNLIALTIGIAATPFLAYGSCFAALAVIGSIAIVHSDRWSKRRLVDLIVMTTAFAIAAIVSYLTIAKYQAYVASAGYLVEDYPPAVEGGATVWVARSLKWLMTSLRDYIGFHFSGRDSAILFIFIMVVSITRFIIRLEQLRREPILLLFVVLVGGCILAAFLRLYPFGGIRQQLFAAPIVILATVCAGAQLYAQFDGQWRRLILSSIAAITLAGSVTKLPAIYSEREDIRSAVTRGLQGADPKNVYVYYGAVPAVDFYYSDNDFMRGTGPRGNIAAMADEAIRVASDRKLYLLFSHVFSNEDDLLIAELRARGWTVVRDRQFTGSRAVYLSR
jgi:hypothetical protein